MYETVWVRQLTFSFGVSVYAVSAVLTAFMFGLGAGAYLLSRCSHRIQNPVRVYAWFELGIFVYTLLLYFVLADGLPWLYRWGFTILPDHPVVLNAVRFATSLLLLAVPTTLMGGTLPVLSRLLQQQRHDTVGPWLGQLYGINTLGGMFGTGLAGFWLLKDLGIFGTTLLALLLNLVIALLAFAYSSRTTAGNLMPIETPGNLQEEAVARRAGSRLVLTVLFLSGYTALSYEVIWNRTLLLYTHNSTYAFTTILIIFLLGISLGSLLYSRFASRLTSMRILGLLQLGLAAYVWLSFFLFRKLPALLSWITDPLGTDSWTGAMATIVFATSLVVLIPTVFMGMTFPMATALATPRTSDVSSTTGRAYACLTLGNILGASMTGLLLIGWLGLRNTFAVAISFNLLGGFLLIGYRRGAYGRQALGLVSAVAVMGLFLASVERDVFRQHYAEYLVKILFYKEEVTDNVMVHELQDGSREIFYSDGRGTAGTMTDRHNRTYAHIPMLLHQDPQSVLTICFGVGNTLSAFAQYEPERLACVELSPGALEAARFFPTNRNVLQTPNLELHIEDGRNYLLRSNDRFDVIQLEPPELHQAAVVNLYTREFYQLARDRLNPHGIFCQWYSTFLPDYEERMIIRAMSDVFPHTSLWSGGNQTSLVLIGSLDEIRIDPATLQSRASQPAVREDLKGIDEDEWTILAKHLLSPSTIAKYVADVPPVTDDRTYVDFSIPQSPEAGFGVFIYNTFQTFDMWSAAVRKRFRDNLSLESKRESPSYLIDFSAVLDDERLWIQQRIGQAVELQRARAQAVLEIHLGREQLDTGRLDLAEQHFLNATAADPRNVGSYVLLARIHEQRGDRKAAERFYRQALEVRPDMRAARLAIERIEKARSTPSD